MHRRAFVLSAAATACTTPTPESPLASSANMALEGRHGALLAPYVQARDFSGVVLVDRGGALVAQRAYGSADIATGRQNTAGTRYICSSIGKLFTRAAVLSLAVDNRLSLSDPFARFAPDF